MEASEKPQLPIDQAPDHGDGVVRALDDRLVIERLTVSDERAARVVRERAEGGQEAGRHGGRRDRDRRPGARPRGRGGGGRLRAA